MMLGQTSPGYVYFSYCKRCFFRSKRPRDEISPLPYLQPRFKALAYFIINFGLSQRRIAKRLGVVSVICRYPNPNDTVVE
jgi:hypothetical protein